jgi:hypothetical protein
MHKGIDCGPVGSVWPIQSSKWLVVVEQGNATGKLGAGIWLVASSWLPKIQQDLLIRSIESTPVMNEQFSMRIS